LCQLDRYARHSASIDVCRKVATQLLRRRLPTRRPPRDVEVCWRSPPMGQAMEGGRVMTTGSGIRKRGSGQLRATSLLADGFNQSLTVGDRHLQRRVGTEADQSRYPLVTVHRTRHRAWQVAEGQTVIDERQPYADRRCTSGSRP
jgi:hypothetical protein